MFRDQPVLRFLLLVIKEWDTMKSNAGPNPFPLLSGTMRITTFCLILFGCPSPRGELKLKRQAAVFYQAIFEKLLAEDNVGPKIKGYCLGIESAQGVLDPPDDLFEILKGHVPRIWRMSECGPDFRWTDLSVHDTVSILLEPPTLQDDGVHAVIDAWYSRGSTHGERYRCHFNKERDRWTLDRCDLTGVS